MLRLSLLLPAFAGALALPAFAQEETPPDAIIVTATRAPDAPAQVSVAATVLSAETLAARQAVIVSDALARTPGISVTRNGGPGGATQVRIRGAETDQTLALIDGVKINDPSATGGGYNFANLLVGDVARIEVLRGPQSTLWGSQAIGGVVNVISRAPAPGLSGAAALEGGGYGTVFARANAGYGGDWGGVRIAASRYDSDGVSSFDDDLGGREDDGFRNTAASLRADLALTESIALDLRAAWFEGRNDFDGFPAPAFAFADTREYGETDDLVAYGGVRAASFGGALRNRFGVAYTQTDRDNVNPALTPAKTFDARGTIARTEYQGEWTIAPEWRLVFGAETERSWFRSAAPSSFNPNPTPERSAVRQDSAYAQLRLAARNGLTLTGGVRFDDHETFGDATTFQAGLVYALADDDTIVRANWGEGFKAPSLYQLYGAFGALTLQPEEAEAWDIGVARQLFDDAVQASIVYFERDTTNQIDFVSCVGAQCATRPFGLYANIARTEARGVELDIAAAIGERLTLSGNYTWLEAENRSPGANFGRDLARRAGRTGALEAAYVWPNALTTSIGVLHVGDSFDDARNAFRLKAYTLVDVRAHYPLTDAVELYGRIENVADERYQTIRRYGTQGRTATIGARVRLE
ncbi:MAG: TonB-dependent receptor [Hyphomonadaceae bacterium]|nr:TonB-dependent receptor [Hyphomonadaceae bacterium]